MSSGCCGVKKQKLSGGTNQNATIPKSLANGLGASASTSKSSSCLAMNGGGGGISHSASNFSSAYLPVDQDVTTRDNTTVQPRVVTKDMAAFCFDVLHSHLNCREPPKNPKFPNDKYPLFVTWKIERESRGNNDELKLRGCIGTFSTTNLHQGLREYAITSAIKDSRFDPIAIEELDRLHCSVSLLMNFETAQHFLDWEIGSHGIRIEFTNERGSKKAATYLPEVALEQGWNQIQTIDSLLRKGGFRGSISQEFRSAIMLTRFRSEKITASYHEYLDMLSYVGGHNGQPLDQIGGGQNRRVNRHSYNGDYMNCHGVDLVAGSSGYGSSNSSSSSGFLNGFLAVATGCATGSSHNHSNQSSSRYHRRASISPQRPMVNGGGAGDGHSSAHHRQSQHSHRYFTRDAMAHCVICNTQGLPYGHCVDPVAHGSMGGYTNGTGL